MPSELTPFINITCLQAFNETLKAIVILLLLQSTVMTQPPNEKTEQLQAIPSMTISTGGSHQNVKNLPFTNGKRQWSHGLLGCFGDCGTYVQAWFCPCMAYSKNKHRVEYLNQNGRPDPDVGGNGVDGDCAMHYLLTCLIGGGFILQMVNRGIIRNRYNIEGSKWEDCLTSLCCRSCALTQESRELGLEEQSLMG